MIESLFSAVFEVFIAGTGRLVLGWFGKKQPSDAASVLTGLAFLFALGMFALFLYSRFH